MNLFPLICDHLQHEPELVLRAMETLDRWEEKKLAPARRIQQWKKILSRASQDEAGRQELIALLLDENDAARQLKSFAPFAGLLPRDERRKVFTRCIYDH